MFSKNDLNYTITKTALLTLVKLYEISLKLLAFDGKLGRL